jgi:hypothetical protein
VTSLTPLRFYHWEKAPGWLDPTAGLDDMKIVLRLETQHPGCPGRSLSLYRLRYRSSEDNVKIDINEIEMGNVSWIQLALDRKQ